MAAWSGLGVNYKSVDSANIASDISYFKSIGIRYIRPHIPDYTNTSDVTLYRTVAKTFHDAGFYVQYGVSASSITSSNWTDYANAVKAEALQCQNTQSCDEFGLGNELELKNDESISDAQIRVNLKTLATEVQPIFTLGPISYQVSQGDTFTGWVSDNDLGDIDLLGVNTYGVWTNSRYLNQTYKSVITNLVATFGNKGYISEFNLDSDSTRFLSIPKDVATVEMYKMMEFIKASGLTRAQLYQWRTYKDSSTDDFNLKKSDQSFKLMWNPLSNNNKRYSFIEV